MKGYEDLCLRNRLRLAMLRKRGRIEYNQSGEQCCIWSVMFSRPETQQYADGAALDFTNHQAFRRLKVNWGAYTNTDSITVMQRAMNEGDNAIVKLYQTKINNLMTGITDDFNRELYKDGSATGRENAIHGLETFLTATTPNSTDRIAKPNDTYGSSDALSCINGADGGTWSADLTSGSTMPNAALATDWPDGYGSPEYDYNSPRLINYSASTWGTGATSWEANCWRVISQAITWGTVTGGQDGTPTLISLASNLFQGYKNHHESLRRIHIPFKEASDLGFNTNTLNQDGVGITLDFDIPANTGYVENLNKVTISSLMPQLFWSLDQLDKKDNLDLRTLSYLMVVGFFGQARYLPKYVGKIYPYA
jgi:hypothetical protein